MRHFASRAPSAVVAMQAAGTIKSPRLAIEYCTRCNWMLRSAWTAQELLTTFNGTVGEVALVPNHEGDGTFEVTLLTSQGELRIWSRADEGRFPESKELKSLVRDAIDPGKDLGHSEAPSRNSGTTAFSRLVRAVGIVAVSSYQYAAIDRLVRCSSTASQRLQPFSFRRWLCRTCLGPSSKQPYPQLLTLLPTATRCPSSRATAGRGAHCTRAPARGSCMEAESFRGLARAPRGARSTLGQ